MCNFKSKYLALLLCGMLIFMAWCCHLMSPYETLNRKQTKKTYETLLHDVTYLPIEMLHYSVTYPTDDVGMVSSPHHK